MEKKTLTYRIPASLAGEVDALDELIEKFRSGALSSLELKAHRVPFGIYEQRTLDTYMVRIRCAAGVITPCQLRRAALLAQEHGSGRLHITTRQELQVHDLAIERIIPVLRGLAEVGLSSRGGGGNTVRNITASWDSGVSSDEPFDVTPHAIELTSRMIARTDSWLLPRKFKIAFSNSGHDTAYATVNDLGFVAVTTPAGRGFRVFVAGGLGRMPQAGLLLHEHVPERDVFVVAEAVKRLFSRLGNRRNRHAARLRFLWNTLGSRRFVAEYERERAAIEAESPAPFVPPPWPIAGSSSTDLVPVADGSAEFATWKARYARAQVRKDLSLVRIPVPLGDLLSSQAVELADLLEPFGDDTIRFTHDQNISVRNIPERFLGVLFRTIGRVTPLRDSPVFLGNAVACAGASTCQLGICRSRGALTAATNRLAASGVDLDSLADVRLHISGCSNSCGQHATADLGFFGKAGRNQTHAFPAYTVVGGWSPDAVKGSTLSRAIDTVAARDLPALVEELLGDFAASREPAQPFRAYLETTGYERIRAFCNAHRSIPSYTDSQDYYHDWDAAEPFSLKERRSGECAAGLFDLIDVDLGRLRSLRASIESVGTSPATEHDQSLRDLALVSSRALLVTRGVQWSSESQIPELFEKHFIDEGLVPAEFRRVTQAAQSPHGSMLALRDDVLRLAQTIEYLYSTMNESLQFHRLDEHGPEPQEEDRPVRVDLSKDFRGVACPMNFVKTKLALAQISAGQMLEVLLDDGEPIDNVPRSLEAERHRIVRKTRQHDHWSLIVEKAAQ